MKQIYKITHNYSYPGYERYILTNIKQVELWNIVKLLQHITWCIDSSFLFDEDAAVRILTQFYGAKKVDHNDMFSVVSNNQIDGILNMKTNWDIESDEITGEVTINMSTIDLHLNGEGSFLNEDYSQIDYDFSASAEVVNNLIKKYSVYKPGLYSAILQTIIESEGFWSMVVGDNSSVLLNNEIWDQLFQEGVFERESFLSHQLLNPHFKRDYDFELSKQNPITNV